MTEKEYVEKAFSRKMMGFQDKVDRDLQVIARELAIIADTLKNKEAQND